MRRVTLNPNNPRASLTEIARASQDGDITDIGQAFTMDATPAQTLALLVASPTLANTNLVLANLIQILQKGGLNRST
jgi:hypothetical protein